MPVIFTTKVNPAYDDLPEVRYHFPRTYLNTARQAVGNWVVYYEPRRESAELSSRGGRQCYFAMARIARVEPDPRIPDHFYAYVSDYQDFPNPVPFRIGTHYFESGLRKDDGSTNKGLFGRAVRGLPQAEFELIAQMGFAEEAPREPMIARSAVYGEVEPEAALLAAEDASTYGAAPRATVLQERPFRDAAFARCIRETYKATCAFTGLALINGGGRCEMEAAHIRPISADGPDSVRNGIALSRTVHWMFDRGILSMEDDGTILMAKKLVPEPVRRMLMPEGRALLPQDAARAPHPVFLRFHREVIFKGE